MEKIRVSVVIESGADVELYHYLVNVPSRRRATLIRTFATQGMHSEGYLKAVSTKIENKSVVNLAIQEPKNSEPMSKSNDTDTANENEKEKALNKAIVNFDFE